MSSNTISQVLARNCLQGEFNRQRGEGEAHSASRSRNERVSLPNTITPISLRELLEMKNRWSLPSSDPSRRPEDLLPGETALFLFETVENPLPRDGLAELLSMSTIKVFLISSDIIRSSAVRRRMEEPPAASSSRFHWDASVPKRSCAASQSIDDLLMGDNAGRDVWPNSCEPLHTGPENDLFPISSYQAASSVLPTPVPSQPIEEYASFISRSTQDTLDDVFLFSAFRELFSQTTNQNFLAPPSMILWRCGGAPLDHYGKYFYYDPDTNPSLIPPDLMDLTARRGSVLSFKTLTSNSLLPCYTSFLPVYTPQQLFDLTVLRGPSGFTVLMVGASTCPPCRRIMQNAATLHDSLPDNMAIYKADWELGKEAREVYNVELIPFFILYKNEEILRRRNPEPFTNTAALPSERWEPVATIQNSNVNEVIYFLHRHGKELNFDEDF